LVLVQLKEPVGVLPLTAGLADLQADSVVYDFVFVLIEDCVTFVQAPFL